MKYHELDLSTNKSKNRVGRGIAAGQGKTAGRGTKGQRARTGKKLRAGFEGGQTTLMMRLPKQPGFRSTKPKVQQVYTGDLSALAGKKVSSHELAEAGLISTPFLPVKIILKGELTDKVDVSVQAISAGAKKAIEAAGGSVTIVPRSQRTAQPKTETTDSSTTK